MTSRTPGSAPAGPRRPIAQNCSGKHAAMLATCVVNGWDTATYRDPDHPLQPAITDTIVELTGRTGRRRHGRRVRRPVHAYALAGLARAFGRIAAAPAGTAEARVDGRDPRPTRSTSAVPAVT